MKARFSRRCTARRRTLRARIGEPHGAADERDSDARAPGERTTAERIEAALVKVYKEGKHVTRDVGGTAGTQEFTDAVIAALRMLSVPSSNFIE